jgi:hypothetical protein
MHFLFLALIASYIPPADAVLQDLDRDGRYETLQVGFVSSIDSAALAAAIDSVVVFSQNLQLAPVGPENPKMAHGKLALPQSNPKSSVALFYAKGDPKPHEVPFGAGALASALKFQMTDFARQSREAADRGEGGLGVTPQCEAGAGGEVSTQISIFAADGTPMAEIQKTAPCGAFVRWDLKEKNGTYAPNGTYIAKIKAKLSKNGSAVAEESSLARWGILWEKP